VERDHGPPAEGAASFHTTRWTIVMRAAQTQAPGGLSALAELCRNYWYPLYLFARRRGHSPDDAPDNARWAMTLLAAALARLRREYAAEGKTSTFEALKVFLDPVNSRAPPSYEEAANRLQVTTGAVKTIIHRLRKRYTALVREEVGRTVSDPAEIDEEIHALCEALIASEGRLGP
jgi:MYXO-CTERM domain-containing protein